MLLIKLSYDDSSLSVSYEKCKAESLRLSDQKNQIKIVSGTLSFATMAGGQEKFLNSRLSRMAKTVTF